MPETVHLNLAPPLTPTQMAENEAFAEEMSVRFTIPDSMEEHGRRVITQNLEILKILRDQYLAAKDPEVKAQLVTKAEVLKIETCQWLVKWGEFEKAAKIHPDKANRAKYRLYAVAEARQDIDWCAHPKYKMESGTKIPNYFREFDYKSAKSGQKLTMLQCSECGFRNAQGTPDDLAALDRKIGQAAAKRSKTGK